ncbi:CCCH-type zinc finger protein with ARM repeat domain-containing protein [Perilla frutescens var. hirtella]|uniref:CCCH-type zinc finger protein with ARM repeat domain-containing protein n=1 Tax=Perilla frutescens var. hirtella TaxID=608512 RepID=A0AAD4J8V1_PERFH|nr:CCCH-type zinc finger protein with ARM repeat domain-containing protein [Perilla frutescens var. hirtella]
MDDHTSSDNFRMFRYKVQPCSLRVGWHAWHECPYHHRGEIIARRRDPLLHYYLSTQCPDLKKSGSCPRRDGCWHAHSTFEVGLHPCYYRTERCRYGANCNRRVCFFAHTDELKSFDIGH